VFDDYSKFKADSIIHRLIKEEVTPQQVGEDFSRLSRIRQVS